MQKRSDSSTVRLMSERNRLFNETEQEAPKSAYEIGASDARGMVAQALLESARQNNLIKKSNS